MKPIKNQFLPECETESNDKFTDCGVALEIMNDEDIECAVVTNTGHAEEHSQIVEFQRYPIKSRILAFGRYISELCKQIILNFVFECIAGIVLTIILWCSMCAYLNVLSDSNAKINFRLRDVFLLVQLYVISSIGSQIMKINVILPPMMGTILVTVLTYEYIIEDSRMSILYYMYNKLFVFIINEFTTLVVMIHGAFEWDVWELRRIGGVLSRLVLLPLAADWIILILVAMQLDANFDESILLFSIVNVGFYWTIISPVVLLPNLSRLKRMGYGEEKNIITLLVAASCIMDLLTSITDGLLLHTYINLLNNYIDNIEVVVTKILPYYCIDVLTEIIFGIMYGLLMIFVPHPKQQNLCNIRGQERNENHNIHNNRKITIIRVFLLCVEGLLIMLYKWSTNFPLTCSLGCALTCIVASTGWKWRDRKERRENPMISNTDDMEIQNQKSGITKLFEVILTILCPMVFGIIGIILSNIIFNDQMGGIEYVVICLSITYTYRIILTTISIWGYGFNLKEIVFINISCIVCSSGTVCYLTILYCLNFMSSKLINSLIALSFIATMVSIILRAMLGYFLIHWFGVRLLKRPTD